MTLVLAGLSFGLRPEAQAAPGVVRMSPVPGPAFPVYERAEQLTQACHRGLTQARLGLGRLEQAAPDGRWLRSYDELNAQVEDVLSPIALLANVHPTPSVRAAAEACELRFQDFSSSLAQNERLFKAARQVAPADDIDRSYLKTTLDAFEDAGVSLPPAKRNRAKQINDRLTELAQTFDRHIRDAQVRTAFTEAELAGVPAGAWTSATRDAQGRYLLGVDYPTYYPVMQQADLPATRERMWRAKTNEGGPANIALLAEMVSLRKAYAGLFGLDSYDDFVLRRRMALSRTRVDAFLGQVQAAVQAREQRELASLRQLKADQTGQALASTRLDRWDLPYYTERDRRKRYQVDQEAFRSYFPPEDSLQFVLRVTERLMGVRYTRVPGVRLWHPQVQAYAVSDAATGKALATLYVDLYPREGKYKHAAVWPLRGGSAATSRIPQAALVVNVDRKGLTLDELETLLHEFGHAVHNDLSATRYAGQAGTNVQRDFVEAPSQMLEDWVYDPQVLALFQEVCPSCKPVPEALMTQAREARHYGKGMLYARQHLYASYDLALYGPQVLDPLQLWAQMEGATPLGHVPDTLFPAGFSHIASGYAAGYYGYLWSLVVATDLRTAFGNNKLDAQVGRRYRDIILANGAQRPPEELVREFLGRDFNAQAFDAYLKR